jgi:hypothetical protein
MTYMYCVRKFEAATVWLHLVYSKVAFLALTRSGTATEGGADIVG